MTRIGLVVAVVWSAFTLTVHAQGQSEYEQQNEAFERRWGEQLVWKFDDLPLKAEVPEFRIPYSGHDYPDRGGGTIRSLMKYDRAFRTGGRAASWERWDTTAYQEPIEQVRIGLFGRRVVRRGIGTPHWHGHCNGWTAAAIRHPEPVNAVVYNGVRFSPADIKGLLAEIYMYQDIEYLGGAGFGIDPATFHVVLTNWLGRGKHPVAMDSTLGKEVWNYPIYKYRASATRAGANAVDVQLTFTYAQSTRQEMDKGPRLAREMYMHYRLTLDEQGLITGGFFFNDSNQVDILWAPVAPVKSGAEGNKRGNPHVDINQVLAIWRQSVPEETRAKWFNIDPLDKDAILKPGEEFANALLPLQTKPAPPAEATSDAEPMTEAETEGATETGATNPGNVASPDDASATEEPPALEPPNAGNAESEPPATEPAPPADEAGGGNGNDE